MLKKINGYPNTNEAAEYAAAIEVRANNGASLFSTPTQQPTLRPGPQTPSR